MINQEKVKDMTKMAVYESRGGDKDLSVSAYRRKDYVALQLLKSFIYGTISYAILLALVLFGKPEIMDGLTTTDAMLQMGLMLGIGYIVFLVVFLIITFVWARKRHGDCAERAKTYSQELNRVARSYQDTDSDD